MAAEAAQQSSSSSSAATAEEGATRDWYKVPMVRYWNTLHGFNPLGGGGSYAVAFLCVPQEVTADFPWPGRWRSLCRRDEIQAMQSRLDAALGAAGVCFVDDYLGQSYLNVPGAHRRRIPDVINAALGAGCQLRLDTGLRPEYEPGDAPFSVEKSEALAIARFEKSGNLGDASRQVGDKLRDTRLWKTEAGRQFARRVHAAVDWNHEFESLQWEPLCLDWADARLPFDAAIDYPPAPLPAEPVAAEEAEPSAKVRRVDSESSSSAQREDEEAEEFLCMVCMAEPPDTIVHPCMHCVVCRACSVKLRASNDARVCLRCRQRIERVDE